MLQNVLGIIMAGGAGSRLWPLTRDRAKPAVPIAGKFRLIDIPISNCINSNIRKIFVLTQFNSTSLNRHITRTYFFAPFSEGFVQILAAQQTIENRDWYQGTADSVRKNLRYFMNKNVDYHLILAGDHLYAMDYRKLLEFHIAKDADVTIGVLPVKANQAREFGILKVDQQSRIIDFIEKPRTDDELASYLLSKSQVKSMQIDLETDICIASMGIYMFNKQVLSDLLTESHHTDFGKGIVPYAIQKKRVFGYLFKGYWEDIGTIGSFYSTMMDLVAPVPKFNFYQAQFPIYTRPRYLPGAKITDCRVCRSVINEGAIIEECHIEDSLIGIRARIRKGSKIMQSLIMGRDFYETEEDLSENIRLNRPDTGIGKDCLIEGAIIDKNARIGDGVQILNQNRDRDVEENNYVIREGVVVVSKNSMIPPGTVIG
jgi:glucose-1-phosphate adenylyltransferase